MSANFLISWRVRSVILLAATMICLQLGCGGSDPDRARLVGEWGVAHAESVMRRLEETRTDEQDESPRMVLQFLHSGELQTATRIGDVDQTKQGRWEMVSFDTAANTMIISCTIKLQKTEHRVLFIDPDTIELTPPNMAGLSMKLKFKRQ